MSKPQGNAFDRFTTRQEGLKDRVRRGEAAIVFLDPDGTWPSWTFVVVEAPTGVIYSTQCQGVACAIRFVEGFLVPLGDTPTERGEMKHIDLTQPFHSCLGCGCGEGIAALGVDKFGMLKSLVQELRFWHCAVDDGDKPTMLTIDESRGDEIVEAWVPVLTSYGPGVLLWDNCD